MRRMRTGLAALSLSFGAVICAGAAAQTQPAPVAQQALEALREVTGLPGLAFSIANADGTGVTLVAGVVDLATGEPVTADTRFRLGSVSKPVTALLVARALADGDVDLDQPLETLMADCPPELHGLTLRQLLSHTAGLPHYGAERSGLGQTHYPRSRDAFPLFLDRVPVSPPGETYTYSSYGYTVVAAVLEEITGTPFPDQLEAAFPEPDGIRADSGAYRLQNNRFEFSEGAAIAAPEHDYSYTWPGGGMIASAPVLARFGSDFVQGHLVDAARVNVLTTPASDQGKSSRRAERKWRWAGGSDSRHGVKPSGTMPGCPAAGGACWPSIQKADRARPC